MTKKIGCVQHDCLECLARQQREQEPVAWVCQGASNKHDIDFDGDVVNAIPVNTDLYTSPPQRPWLGLTNNELQPIADQYRILFGSWVEDFARDIEAKLKEKNHG